MGTAAHQQGFQLGPPIEVGPAVGRAYRLEQAAAHIGVERGLLDVEDFAGLPGGQQIVLDRLRGKGGLEGMTEF